MSGATAAYEDRMRNECTTFAEATNIHDDLPPAFHHWSARHVLPKLQALGLDTLDDFFVTPLVEAAARATGDAVVLSIGSGNGEQELGWLTRAVERGATNLRLRLLEINPSMQRRAADLAAELGFADRVEFLERDFNTWTADAEHDVVVANQALHHVTDLEHLYAEVKRALRPDGVFVVSDMIGRNGHRRWPEALEVVERLWATLPAHLRRNNVTGQVDDVFPDPDCATVGFEGVRAQDVLPLLLDVFYPDFFFAFANVVDPFVDRVYGANFDLADEEHRAFVEHLGQLDDARVDAGVVSPTHLLATFRTTPVRVRYHGLRSPRRCVRDTSRVDPAGRVSFSPAGADPRGVVRGAALACGRINGLLHDGWVGELLDLPLYTTEAVHALRVTLYVPDTLTPGTLTLSVDGTRVHDVPVRSGLADYVFPLDLPARRQHALRLHADWFTVPDANGTGGDTRRLSYVLSCLEFGEATLLHAGLPPLPG
ncbi:MAG TPA: methyltransferase domain-containing protein [Longimicrobiaceae bacterium]|nr:methyltransferase domain-containing protein [Longimicrobiaceae bacterium]